MTAALLIIGLGLLVWAAFNVYSQSTWDPEEGGRFGGGWIPRSERPVTFWMLVACQTLLGLVCVAGALGASLQDALK